MPSLPPRVGRFKVCCIVWLTAILSVTTSPARSSQPSEQPLVFAAVADVQYADRASTSKRHYRPALALLEQCVADLNRRQPAFVIQLGDLVDGPYYDQAAAGRNLDRVLAVFNRLTVPSRHVIGNHCLFAGEDSLHAKLGLKRFYYDFTLPSNDRWRFVVLDGNDGGYATVGPEQIEWFAATLAKAAAQGQRVVCFCHYPLLRNKVSESLLLKPRSLLDTIDRAGCVVACFAGHHHSGGYALHHGVHHVTLKAMVGDPAKPACALIELLPDRLHITGIGREPSRDLPLPSLRATQPSSNRPG